MSEDTNRNKGMVSVIIPVYNCEETIDECIQSIKKQSYENWEVIIVDDGSTDNTYKKADAWAKSDMRIKVFRQENQGSGPSRNRGMKEAEGEYIAFLDGDDFWQNAYALKRIMDALKEEDCDVIGTFPSYYKNGRFVEIPLHRRYFTLGEESGKWIDFRDEQNCYFYCSYLYRRSFLVENNIAFPPYRRFQDPPFLAEVLEKVQRYYVIPIEWWFYRYEYKNVLSTEQKINDYLNGILDVVKIAHCQAMSKLMKDTVNIANSRSGIIIKSILQGNIEALRLVAELQKYIGDRAIENFSLQFINQSLQAECKRIADVFIQEINEISKLIIYGSGTYGQHFLESITKLNVCTEIVFAQTNEPLNRIICGRACYKLDELVVYKEESLVIVAAKSEEMQNDMISNLRAMGFEKYQLYAGNLLIALECIEAEEEIC
ncbi:MAG: glycosyltransferase family 2 protein [Lachnospiraceae bacterium]|nr:glycosyltransferase family 2 protein [Lachnospiraceae bacterium]